MLTQFRTKHTSSDNKYIFENENVKKPKLNPTDVNASLEIKKNEDDKFITEVDEKEEDKKVKGAANAVNEKAILKQKKYNKIYEMTEKFTKDNFITALTEITVASYPLDKDYIEKNARSLKEEVYEMLDSMVENKVLEVARTENSTINTILSQCKVHGQQMADLYVSKGEIAYSNYVNENYKPFITSVFTNCAEGIKITKNKIKQMLVNETEKVQELQKAIHEYESFKLATNNKKDILREQKIKKLAKPTFYQTIMESIIVDKMEKKIEIDNQEIQKESIMLYGLFEALGTFKVLNLTNEELTSLVNESAKIINEKNQAFAN